MVRPSRAVELKMTSSEWNRLRQSDSCTQSHSSSSPTNHHRHHHHHHHPHHPSHFGSKLGRDFRVDTPAVSVRGWGDSIVSSRRLHTFSVFAGHVELLAANFEVAMLQGVKGTARSVGWHRRHHRARQQRVTTSYVVVGACMATVRSAECGST